MDADFSASKEGELASPPPLDAPAHVPEGAAVGSKRPSQSILTDRLGNSKIAKTEP